VGSGGASAHRLPQSVTRHLVGNIDVAGVASPLDASSYVNYQQ